MDKKAPVQSTETKNEDVKLEIRRLKQVKTGLRAGAAAGLSCWSRVE